MSCRNAAPRYRLCHDGEGDQMCIRDRLIIPGANHTDLYDQMDVIPFEKLDEFFGEYLK